MKEHMYVNSSKYYICYFSFIDAKIENVYIHQRHCSLPIVYNLKSQTKQ